MFSDITVEICCAHIETVELAHKYGADAIELCVDLENGGLTPSMAFIKKSRNIFKKELAVFFRPRNGNFFYTSLEQELILDDIQFALDIGIDTIVSGGLNHENKLDLTFIEKLRNATKEKILSFHRAVDITSDPELLLKQLIEFNVDRVLSSGGAITALDGIDPLQDWNTKFGDSIQIMAAGGIHPGNVKEILTKTGLKRFHASLRKKTIKVPGILDLGNEERIDEVALSQLFKVLGR